MLTKADFQRLRSLRDKKEREALGLFVIEGDKVVSELLAAHFPLVEIYAISEWRGFQGETQTNAKASARATVKNAGEKPRPRMIQITPDEMARASHFPTPSPVLAVGKISRLPLTAGTLDHGLTLALDGVQDAGNVGTLLRIADWFAFDRVVLSPDCADLFHQKVIQASMGSFARITAHVVDLAAALAEIRPATPILGCDLAGEDVHTLPSLRDAVVVIGNEGRGLSPAVLARVTRRVTIPRLGHAESLNAAVAAAIVCDNLRRLART